MANNNLTINVTVSGVEDIEKLTREFEKLKALVGADRISVEPSEPTYRLVSGRDARVGDYVKFTEESYEWITVGKYYEVVGFDEFGDAQVIDNDGDAFDICGETYEIYEKVTEATAEPEPLKVGDYAKVIQAKHRQEGTIVKLEKYDPGYETDYEFISIKLDGTEGDIFKSEHLVKATEEEAAEAKAKAVETERWAKIGRKVNEYKVGDIVGTEHYGLFEITAIDERLEHPIHGIIFGNKDAIKKEGITLITPVEARFDRA